MDREATASPAAGRAKGAFVGSRLARWIDLTVFGLCVAYVITTVPHAGSFLVGVAIVALFTPFWVIARLQLGASFSVDAQARRLVTSGLYAKFRHPVYVFGTVAVLGLLVAALGYKALVIGVVLVPVQMLRAIREDRVLGEAFGAEYAAYRQTTWF